MQQRGRLADGPAPCRDVHALAGDALTRTRDSARGERRRTAGSGRCTGHHPAALYGRSATAETWRCQRSALNGLARDIGRYRVLGTHAPKLRREHGRRLHRRRSRRRPVLPHVDADHNSHHDGDDNGCRGGADVLLHLRTFPGASRRPSHLDRGRPTSRHRHCGRASSGPGSGVDCRKGRSCSVE